MLGAGPLLKVGLSWMWVLEAVTGNGMIGSSQNEGIHPPAVVLQSFLE